MNPIPIVDLFAGPGGLGEGFSSLRHQDGKRVFKIAISAEMESSAHRTLTLRAYYRQFLNPSEVPQDYFDYIACPATDKIRRTALKQKLEQSKEWKAAVDEAFQLTLGDPEDNRRLESLITERISDKNIRDWILVGGPPCQAYSLVGRARNSGNEDYSAETDGRHFLYQEYLKIIEKFQPAVFIMENVKGILSSKVGDKRMFSEILNDLSAPLNSSKGVATRYRLYSVTNDVFFEHGMSTEDIDFRKFTVKSEEHGVPQKRHRVFIIGVRLDVDESKPIRLPLLETGHSSEVTVEDVIGDLPALRSGLSKTSDTFDAWNKCILAFLDEIKSQRPDFVQKIEKIKKTIKTRKTELRRKSSAISSTDAFDSAIMDWISDPALSSLSNHETRGHMEMDLARYLFCSIFATQSGENRSPKAKDFPHFLAPEHANWQSGKFADRFRVQLADKPATTITSHISKDGHYFIHPDPSQCRSLTVREAARIQTFPDNYFFEGNRTQQYVQVGNAVPPFLAMKIARGVKELLG